MGENNARRVIRLVTIESISCLHGYMFELCSLLCVLRMGTSIDGRKLASGRLHAFVCANKLSDAF